MRNKDFLRLTLSQVAPVLLPRGVVDLAQDLPGQDVRLVAATASLLVREDTRKVYPERRFVGYNTIEGRLMVVVFCCPTPQRTHIISFRKANDRERKKFEAQSL